MPGKMLEFRVLGKLLPAEDHPSARAAQGLVGGGCDKFGVGHRARMEPRRHQAGDMRHVNHHHRPDLVRNRSECGEINCPWVGAGADYDQLRPVLVGQPLHFLVVDGLVLPGNTIRNNIEKPAGEVHRAAVGQMAAMREVHPEHGVPRFQYREIDRHIGLRSGMGLDIGMVGAEKLLCPLNGQVLDNVHMVAAAVIALAGVAFRIFIGQNRALSLQNSL